jgi:3-oxoacyl-[acyl-carrier-protein] synthase-3
MINVYNKEVQLNGVGVYIPENRESNLDLINKFELSEHFIIEKVGFVNRSIKKNETINDLCYKAFENLNSSIKIDKKDVTVLIVVTQNPDQNIPHTSAIVHNMLGLSPHCMTFDISQGCAGFVHGLAVAKSLLKSMHVHDKVLLFTVDPYSKIVNPNSKSEAILFGDAATASLISFDSIGYNIGISSFGTAPNSNDCIVCKTGELEMNGSKVFSHVMDYVVPSIQSIINDLKAKSKKIDLFLVHQGSKYVVDSIRNSFGFDAEVMPFISKDYGNTVSSSIPIMIKYIFNNKKYRRILISGFGVGFTWGNYLLNII